MIDQNKSHTIDSIEEAICLWPQLLQLAEEAFSREASLADELKDFILEHPHFSSAISSRIAHKLANTEKERQAIKELSLEAFAQSPQIEIQCQNDILATVERDAACHSLLAPLLWYKGFIALSAYRVAHYFWGQGRELLAYFLQSKISEKLAVDIHPAANFGCGIMLDHATGFVAGETCIVENNVSILHEVTLGGTGKESGDRHPKIRSGVLIGAGAKILGNIEVGRCAKIGAGSVVLDNVPAHTSVAGVPAKIIGMAQEADPALGMNHHLPCK